MNEKKINPSYLILHAILIWFLFNAASFIEPAWFSNHFSPENTLGFGANFALIALTFPILFLMALWMKTLFNNVIPIIFKFREINYWEAFGILIFFMLLGA
jgi:hypothetical protein